MQEVYDREKTAALLKEAHDITAGLKTEMAEIATQISHVWDGGQEGTGAIEETTCDQLRKDGQVPPTVLEPEPARKPFWRLWR